MISGIFTPSLDRTRPGIRFETEPSVMPEAMPRMDVAAFVGFAERGPLHWPVVIEDMAQFKKVFGVTPQLGWGQNGERVSGNLADSVSSFFTQGGQRCWVVRVAGSSASSNQFLLPGLRKVTPSSGGYIVLPAIAQARCEGGWSDSLRVASRLQTRPVVLENISPIDPGKTWALRTRSDIVRPGDLLRIVREADKKQAFFSIAKVERDGVTGEIVLYAQSAIAFVKRNPKCENAHIPCCPWDQVAIGELSDWVGKRASLVSIDLRVRDERSTEWRAENLGLTPLHPRYCGALPTDIEVFRGVISGSGSSQQTPQFNPGIVATPWFPLAAKSNDIESATGSFVVPLDIDGNFGMESLANPNASSELERDGLSNFDASMFLDPALRFSSVADLMATADVKRYSAPQPENLTGIHAVLGWFNTKIQNEVTLIAVPDAVHMSWQSRPELLRYSLCFAEIPAEENSTRPDSFGCCNMLAAPSELIAGTKTPSGTVLHLSWKISGSSDNTGIEYQVQESATENFLLTDNTWQRSKSELDIAITAPGKRIFRVRAVSATQVSTWSPAIAVSILETEPTGEQNSATGEVAREIQRALIRLCAAQGELFSVLSLPQTISEQDATSHVLTLSATSVVGSSINIDSEDRVGSYAAIYHPWIEMRSINGSVRPLPPDGAILGMIAARTRDRGVWIAPANRSLRSVVALHTNLSSGQQTQFVGAGINLVLHRPEGFNLLSEDTLSGIPDLRPIHVRRLLILLRRMVLRLGEEFTFEPNCLALRALIRQRCNNMLERMFRAGAFAGRSAADSFQVLVDDTDNPPASIDAGRLIVRIRVRPAQALRFITVRFSLSGGATGVVEEIAA